MSTKMAEGHHSGAYATWNNLHTEPIDYFHWLNDVDILSVQGISSINRSIPSTSISDEILKTNMSHASYAIV